MAKPKRTTGFGTRMSWFIGKCKEANKELLLLMIGKIIVYPTHMKPQKWQKTGILMFIQIFFEFLKFYFAKIEYKLIHYPIILDNKERTPKIYGRLAHLISSCRF